MVFVRRTSKKDTYDSIEIKFKNIKTIVCLKMDKYVIKTEKYTKK